jgi:ribosomal protein S18 acetylase RimI-like enzyme
MQLRIRDMRAEDYGTVIALWEEAGLEHHPEGRDSSEAILRELGSETAVFFLAELDGRVVASALCTHDGRKGWINRLAVLPEFQRMGIAKMMIAESERRLAEKGLGMFCSMIWEDNLSSRALFESEGYELVPGVTYYRKKLSPDY